MSSHFGVGIKRECKYGCGKQLSTAGTIVTHERACGRAQKMATAIAENKTGLRDQLLTFLDEKRMPLVAQLAEIDGMIRSLRSHVP